MNAARLISIGLLARQTGCTVPTIRYYEEIGLLPSASRTDGGRRIYGDAAARRLTFIRRCRDFGFSIDQVRGQPAGAGCCAAAPMSAGQEDCAPRARR